MISGVDYIFISNIDGKYVNKCFRDFFTKLWGTPIFDDSLMCSKENKTEHYELFISKNTAMLDFHDENGFALDENGEGCVYLISSKYPIINEELSSIVKNKLNEIECIYKYNLVLYDCWQYTLVLPAAIEDSEFCKLVHGELLSILNSKSS
ncbi:hypothetical protein ABCY62_02130 [Acetivibrio clariflavus]|uniref:hypothetical protein n=1 Tax=Acetivibrio clariflavus TaxID=288965 RepID=UPI0031F5C88D